MRLFYSGPFFSRQRKPTRSISIHMYRKFSTPGVYSSGGDITWNFHMHRSLFDLDPICFPSVFHTLRSRIKDFPAYPEGVGFPRAPQIRTHSFSYAHIYDRVCLSVCPYNVCINNQYCLSNGIFPVSSSQ